MTHVDLTGTWQVKTDGDNRGRNEQWFEAIPGDTKDIPVPGIIQQVFPAYHGLAWYWRKVEVPLRPQLGERLWLRFEAVDYLGDVWFNGRHVGRHEGGETPFEVDITDAVRAGQNLLAVRVLNPRAEEQIEGCILRQTPRSVKDGWSNFGGLTRPVSLLRLPAVRVSDLFVEPDITSGKALVHVTVRNDAGRGAAGKLAVKIGPDREGLIVARACIDGQFPPGESTHELSLTVPQAHWWDLGDPFLYRATVDLDASAMHHEKSVRFGFRDFRVIDGFFRLNGKRIFLRSAHSGPYFPAGMVVPPRRDLVQRDLVLAKACGFNCVRFLSKMPHPEQLDLCDEMGLLVYEESYAAWWGNADKFLGDLAAICDRFRRANYEMVHRDRNHPSVLIWGMLNESSRNEPERQAIAILPSLRKLDPTRLILLGSGRWDGQLGVGSFANPGSDKWEYQWGAEAPGGKQMPVFDYLHHHHEGEGDFHCYPAMPMSADTCRTIREIGKDTKPVFLSECGVGSMFDAIREAGQYQQVRVTAPFEDRVGIEEVARKLPAELKRLGLDGVYPSTAELLRDSQRLNVRQRRRMFDLVRSNPNLCGYSLTQLMDGFAGEGVWTWWRQLKPGVAECLENGWAPLRWCLFVDNLHGYAGRPLRVEAVLANEDVLPPGDYAATFRIWGPKGTVWSKKVDLRLPDKGKGNLPPLAVPVLSETVELRVPPGRYVLTAWLENGAAPADDQLDFQLSDSATLPKVAGGVVAWGLDEPALAWLKARGIEVAPLAARGFRPGEVLVVGGPKGATAEQWQQVVKDVETGATAVFLDPEAFRKGDDPVALLPVEGKKRFYRFHDWLYHKECLAARHPVFEDLPTGLLDWDYYGDVVSDGIFEIERTPDETIAAALGTGLLPGVSDNYLCGPMVACYRRGKGRIILSTLNILSRLDRQPAADRLLLNFIRYGQSPASP